MNEIIEETVQALVKGGTILYPTDTIWGLGCDPTNDEACQKLIDIKGRTADKSFILLADSFRMVEHYIPDFHEVVYDLVDFAEKPLTVIYPGATRLSKKVLAEDGTIGIRITKDPICRKIIQKFRKPIVSTSANFTGEPSPTGFESVDSRLVDQIDYTVALRQKEKLVHPSQIIKIDLDGSVKVIRK